MCKRTGVELTRHHLIPRNRHRTLRKKKGVDRSELNGRIALLCRPCHGNLHASIDNKTLEAERNTLETLRVHPDIERFTEWIRNKPAGLKVTFPRRGQGR